MRTTLLALGVLLVTVACPSTMKREQLEQVAKDWCLTIRASQVIPVYPLSEDLQPGDVLLVSTPLEEQVALYEDKGFLPLDQHFVRLTNSELAKAYEDFYDGRYDLGAAVPPAPWQTGADGALNWGEAPAAAFPSYSFSVSASSGMNLAIPIQGVPFALGLMNTGTASGSVTIADAHSFGLDIVKLEGRVREWAAAHRDLLRAYRPREGEDGGTQRHFLRVVSRVYVTGRVSVTVRNDESSGGQAGAGVTQDKGVMLKGLEQGSSSKNFLEAIGALNRVAEEQLPGADVKVATASSRAVTLNETFARPMVVGYVGFDMPILPGGRLGPPISTLSQLAGRASIPVSAASAGYRLAALSLMNSELQRMKGDDAERIREQLDAIEITWPDERFGSYGWSGDGATLEKTGDIVPPADDEGFRGVIDYLSATNKTIANLQKHLAAASGDTARRAELVRAQAAYEAVNGQLAGRPAVAEAIDFFFLQ